MQKMKKLKKVEDDYFNIVGIQYSNTCVIVIMAAIPPQFFVFAT